MATCCYDGNGRWKRTRPARTPTGQKGAESRVLARVSRFEGFTDHVDRLRVAREQFIPGAHRSGGFEGMYVLVDHESGESLSITLWESREAMQASEEHADSSRQDAALASGGSVVGVEHYEVALSPEQA
jgi:heme-degrading monooxygenase HmoA